MICLLKLSLPFSFFLSLSLSLCVCVCVLRNFSFVHSALTSLVEFPEIVRELAMNNVDVIVVPTANVNPFQSTHMVCPNGFVSV